MQNWVRRHLVLSRFRLYLSTLDSLRRSRHKEGTELNWGVPNTVDELHRLPGSAREVPDVRYEVGRQKIQQRICFRVDRLKTMIL
jgi:hypothetical protein